MHIVGVENFKWMCETSVICIQTFLFKSKDILLLLGNHFQYLSQ